MNTQTQIEKPATSLAVHTPGPWVYNWAKRAVLSASELGEIGHVASKVIHQLPRNPSPEEISNARLIAAAPETKRQRDELLAALKALAHAVIGERQAKAYETGEFAAGMHTNDCVEAAATAIANVERSAQ